MSALFAVVIAVHVATGFVGLAAFWVPIFARKGGRVHKQAGKVYAYCAYVVTLSAVTASAGRVVSYRLDGIAVADQPELYGFAWLLAYLGVVTFAQVRQAIRVVATRRSPGMLRTAFHEGLAWASMAGSAAVAAAAVAAWSPVSPILLGLSPIGIFTGWRMLRMVRRPTEERMGWLYSHLGSMLGGGIAFHTAFLVFGAQRVWDYGLEGPLAIVPWILPTVVGVPAIVVWTRRYRRKFARATAVGSWIAWIALGAGAGVQWPTSIGAQQPGAGGHDALAAGNYGDAIRLLRPGALDGDESALTGWITALLETGEYQDAASAARAAFERGVPGARAHLGAVLLRTGRIEEARAALEAAAQDPGPSGALARVDLGTLEYQYGDRDAARAVFDGFIDYYNDAGGAMAGLSAGELVAVGRAMAYLSRWNYEYAHDALRALDEAQAAGPLDHSARIAVGELFLERYDAAQAAEAFRAVLAHNPNHADAHYGLARVARLEGGGNPSASLDAALAANPKLVGTRVLRARLLLLSGDQIAALHEVERALETNGASLDALGAKAAIHHLAGDAMAFRDTMERVRELTSTPSRPYVVLAELAADHRKYADALDFALDAAATDSNSWAGHGLAGLNQVRLGRVDEGREHLERAFAGDPFNLWFKNTLDLLDTFVEYRVVATEHFRLVLHQSEADLLAPYIGPLAERAHSEMSQRYGWAPADPIRVEVYPRHADFSVRTVGLVGIGALGVSFGPALAIDSPAAREKGSFNWASTLWHEIAHSFHIGASESEVPRWFSEGLAVLEQRKGDPTWGRHPGVGFIRSLASGRLRPVSELDRGFSNPRHPGEVADSYLQASLVLELIEERHGFPAILDMLLAFRDGASNEEAFERALGARLEEFDDEFERHLADRFATAAASVGAEPPGDPPGDLAGARAAVARNPGRFESRMALAQALLGNGQPQDAARHFDAALRLFPEYGGPDGPHWHLGRIREEEGDLDAAANHYRALLHLNESHYEGRIALARVLASPDRDAGADLAGAAEALRGVPFVHPYQIADHERLANILEELRDWEGASMARRAVLALDPVDRATAHFRLARVLYRGGDHATARREVLAALEIAPNYEDALELLLEIRREGNDRRRDTARPGRTGGDR